MSTATRAASGGSRTKALVRDTVALTRFSSHRSRALAVLLLLCLLLFLSACGTAPIPDEGDASSKDAEINRAARGESEENVREGASGETLREETARGEPARTELEAAEAESQKNAQSEEPEKPAQPGETSGDAEGFPEYRDFYSEGDPETPAELVSSDSSAGAIPAVKAFNFGRDPGGPEDKTLSLSVPKLDLADVPVFDTVSEDKLRDGTVHVPATGYPWQKGANVFIAGHRIGYASTDSYYVFYHLDWLKKGDEIYLEDSAGGEYLYRVTKRLVVGPDSVEVMNAVEGESLITLQTCTLPDYEKRLIVQGELVQKSA